ncbi:hypothetical protein E3N88_42059 [Mikania micrantha]|uniref:Uncharacterized protein n=1 Tax=Mikania micrantha TaxID=192012 RepID=A0A5N6LIU0_9ASTR|nr:hypothetical protein E3N88_42059 [Mikania micrantha]
MKANGRRNQDRMITRRKSRKYDLGGTPIECTQPRRCARHHQPPVFQLARARFEDLLLRILNPNQALEQLELNHGVWDDKVVNFDDFGLDLCLMMMNALMQTGGEIREVIHQLECKCMSGSPGGYPID